MSLLGVADRLLHQRQPHTCHTGHIDLNAVSATVCALNQTGSRTCVWGSVGPKLVISRRQLKMMLVREMIPCQQVNERVHLTAFNIATAPTREQGTCWLQDTFLVVDCSSQGRRASMGMEEKASCKLKCCERRLFQYR